MLLAKLSGPHGKVFNFEPLPENLNEIEENFQLNNITNYTNVAAAISSKQGVLQFEMHEHAKQGHLVDSQKWRKQPI
ncbi:MAG: FkbM family methyltransferase [Saprospiraceae bacterium]|nr:FkbM family methyltransferase [Saprospiraceae bacterium]